jgi:hypothetical protein
MRAWSGLRVILHREEWKLTMPNSFDGAVVQIQMSYLESGCPRNTIRTPNHSEAMVLSSNENLIIAQISHRVVAAAVTIGELRRRAAVRQAYELMSQADTEGGKTSSRQLSNALQSVPHCRRIARTIRKEEPVRF